MYAIFSIDIYLVAIQTFVSSQYKRTRLSLKLFEGHFRDIIMSLELLLALLVPVGDDDPAQNENDHYF